MRQLACGDGKLEKGAEELGAADENHGLVEDRPEGIWDIIQGSSSGSVYFRVRDVGTDPLHGTGPGKFSAQGCAADHREVPKDTGVRGLVLSTAGVSYGGGGV